MHKDESTLVETGVFYSGSDSGRPRLKLAARAQWALWALLAGFALGLLLSRLLPG
jgi:hypothetical protein